MWCVCSQRELGVAGVAVDCGLCVGLGRGGLEEEDDGQLAVVVAAVVVLVHLHGEGPSICLGSWTTSERRNN